jgi:hypothetical protein
MGVTALLSLGGLPVMTAEIRMPRVGVWNSGMTIDSSAAVPQETTLVTDDGSFSLRGSAVRDGVFLENLRVRMVGGSGGLDGKLQPKAYNGYTVRSVLTDILSACGETLSPATDSTILNKFLPKWIRLGGTGKSAVHSLMLFAGAESWRILPDGSFWTTTKESWSSAPAVDFEVTTRNISEGWVLIASERPFVLPGQSLQLPDSAGGDTIRISTVTHSVRSGCIEARLWTEDL